MAKPRCETTPLAIQSVEGELVPWYSMFYAILDLFKILFVDNSKSITFAPLLQVKSKLCTQL